MIAMRSVGYVVGFVGVGLGLVAYGFRRPSFIGLNGHRLGTWLLCESLGIALAALGLVIVITHGH